MGSYVKYLSRWFFKPIDFLNQLHTGWLVAFVCDVSMCMCISPSWGHPHEWTISNCFQWAYITLLDYWIDINDRLSNETHHSKQLRQGCISHSFLCRRYFNSCTLVTSWRALILKVGVAPVYWAFRNTGGLWF